MNLNSRLVILVVAIDSAILGSSADTLSSHVKFSDELTNRLYKINENQCSSALGVSMMFSLLYPSMNDPTKTQTETILGFSDTTPTEGLVWANTTSTFDSTYDGACLYEYNGACTSENPIVSVSNSVWVNSGSPISPDYQTAVGDILFETDFGEVEAGGKVNTWVKSATRELIESIVDDGPLSPLVLLAVNAIYFKASWKETFDDFRTTSDKFYTADKLTVTREEAIFMHQVERFPYSHTVIPGFQVLQLPFASGSLSMILVLPTTTAGGTVTSSQVLAALPELDTPRVALALPKFEFETTYSDDLKTSLMDLGLTAPFVGGLCIYEGDCSPFLDVVIQKTYISVDEKGVEAAAVSAGFVQTSLPSDAPFEFLANAPFQFFIYDDSTQVVLFEGRVIDPIPHADSRADPGDHNDPDFWSDKTFVEPERVFDATPVTEAPVSAPKTPVTEAPVVSAPKSAASLPVRVLFCFLLSAVVLL